MAGVVEVAQAALGAAGSGAMGAVLGAIGGIASRAMGIWERKEARKDQVLAFGEAEKVRAHELVLLKDQREGKREETEDELKIREAALGELVARLDGEGLIASIADQTAAAGRASPWVADILALFRPGITLVLFTGLMVIFVATLTPAFDAASAKKITGDVVDTLCFAGNVALLFWFGARPEKAAR